MKVSREQMGENRQRILDAAARLFRRNGFEGVTVAQIMAAAGLTHGGFYGHFKSKDDLIGQAFAHVLKLDDPAPSYDLAGFADIYLNATHRDEPGGGCLFGALGTEAARGPAESRSILTRSMQRQIADLSVGAPGKTLQERRRAAIAGWSTMIGALMLARIADDPALSDEILVEARAALGA